MEFKIQKLQTFTGHRNSIYSLCNGLEPEHFFSASSDKMVVQWNIKEPDRGIPIANLQSVSYAIHFSQAHNLLFVADNQQAVRIIDLLSNKILSNIPLGNRTIFDILVIDDKLLFCDNMGGLEVVDINNFKSILYIKFSEKSIRKLVHLPNNNHIALAISDHSIKIIDALTFKEKYTLNAHLNSVFTLLADLENHQLLSGGRDARLMSWDIKKNYEKNTEIPAHLFAVNHIEDLTGTTLFATASLDKTIKIWEKGTLKLLKVIDRGRYGSHSNSVNRLLWKADLQVLLSTGDDRSILMWKLF